MNTISKGKLPLADIFIRIYTVTSYGHAYERCQVLPPPIAAGLEAETALFLPPPRGCTGLPLGECTLAQQSQWLRNRNIYSFKVKHCLSSVTSHLFSLSHVSPMQGRQNPASPCLKDLPPPTPQQTSSEGASTPFTEQSATRKHCRAGEMSTGRREPL